jgi:hypothetical protein
VWIFLYRPQIEYIPEKNGLDTTIDVGSERDYQGNGLSEAQII